jgi:hypothetical protein
MVSGFLYSVRSYQQSRLVAATSGTPTIKPGQTDVSDAEIEALLRHCWHGELEIPKDF